METNSHVFTRERSPNTNAPFYVIFCTKKSPIRPKEHITQGGAVV